MRAAAVAATLLALLLTGGIAGFFFAYSVSVMPGLDTASPEAAVLSMQRINRAVRNPVFFVTFFLTPVATLIAAALLLVDRQRLAVGAALLAALVYIGGAFVPTVVVNVPMNEALAAMTTGSSIETARATWVDYSPRWTAWNHLRSVASGVSLLLMGIALLAIGKTNPEMGVTGSVHSTKQTSVLVSIQE